MKKKKDNRCPECNGAGIYDEGDVCEVCDGTGEVDSNEKKGH